MTSTDDLLQAARLLLEAVGGDQAERKRQALDAIQDLFGRLFVIAPAELAVLLPSPRADEPAARARSDPQMVLKLLPLLKTNLPLGFHLLRRVLQPAAVTGLEPMFDFAPPFADVEKQLFEAVDSGSIDFDGAAAVLIGRYGAAAKSALPKLIRRLNRHRTNCSLAAGLTWACYMVGGLRVQVLRLLLEVARKRDSCPHARKVARAILANNRISLRTGQFYSK